MKDYSVTVSSQGRNGAMSLKHLRELLDSRDENGNKKRIKVKLISNSMSPVLPTGAVAEIESCTLNDLKFLDFIVFWDGKQPVCHCFFSEGEFKTPSGERTINTRGLANKNFDAIVSESNLLGRIVSHKIRPWQYIVFRIANKIFGAKISQFLFSKCI